ncbi:MarR family winged helix-turn-helix transcriptional regulator [Pseudonocardia zijingensis]|uniref:MarR family transcriptional regulator n=1 Tax=Pseudonocardia zijingensis TaxID=153376 RepID=A0ABP4A368_9PSEU
MTEHGPPVTSSLALLLVGAGRVVQRRVEAALAPHGLTLRHLGALGHLSRRPDTSYSDLARRAGVTAQSMHATVRQLQELGAVATAETGQGRRARLDVTDRGRELLAEVGATLRELDAELFRDLPEGYADQLTPVLAGLFIGGAGRGSAG